MNRLRWRLSGAWMWPSFVVLIFVDGAITHWRPPVGDSVSAVGGAILGLTLSLIAIVALAPALGAALRQLRPDMPRVVARDYGGATAAALVTAALLAAGLVHRHTVTDDSQALQDATARAVAYIGDHAPTRYQRSLHTSVSVDQLQPPEVYRVCIDPTSSRSRSPYCVVVNRRKPFATSVSYAGHEPNATLELDGG